MLSIDKVEPVPIEFKPTRVCFEVLVPSKVKITYVGLLHADKLLL